MLRRIGIVLALLLAVILVGVLVQPELAAEINTNPESTVNVETTLTAEEMTILIRGHEKEWQEEHPELWRVGSFWYYIQQYPNNDRIRLSYLKDFTGKNTHYYVSEVRDIATGRYYKWDTMEPLLEIPELQYLESFKEAEKAEMERLIAEEENRILQERIKNGTHMNVTATAYYPSNDGMEGGFRTSCGMAVEPYYTIAVDPRVIPYHSEIYIPSLDMYGCALDCGGAIKGNIIDIAMSNSSECNNWGRRNIEIVILN